MQYTNDFKKLSLEARLLWLIVGLGAVSVSALAMIAAFSFSASSVITLLVGCVIAGLTCSHRAVIPFTNIRISTKAIFVFWGIVWLGPAGAILLSLAASIAERSSSDRAWTAKFYGSFCDILAAYTAAFVYFVAFGYANARLGDLESTRPLIPTAMLIAVPLMVVTNYTVRGVLAFLGRGAEGGVGVKTNFVRSFIRPAANYAACMLATFVLYLVFRHFGIELGLVLLPAAIFGFFGGRIYHRMLEQKTKEIFEASRLHLATVEALASAIDARDQIGAGHIRRTQIFAVGLGHALGLPEKEINTLRAASLLHDIGKLAVPDHILNKPTHLTQAELEKTKIHVSVGASILEKAGFKDGVVPTVRHHHEWFNGGGYPDALRGNSIPLTARILTIADVYDTLRGARPYRSPMTREEAGNILLKGAGRQFDPKFVKVFLEHAETLEAEVIAQGLSYRHDEEVLADPHISLAGITVSSYIEEIKRANREVFSLYEIARDFGSSENLEKTLAMFTRRIAEFVPYDNCIVYLMDDSGTFATAKHADGKNHAELKGKVVRVGEGATGYVLEERKSINGIDPALDFAFSEFEFTSKYVGMVSFPLITENKLLGAVTLYSNEIANYDEEHLRLLETVSRIAATSVYRSQTHDRTKNFAMTDPLTALPNGRALQQQFDKETARAGRSDTNFQLLMLDLDGFKSVNDTYGHREGDIMLREVSAVIRGQLRDYDFLARYGGDEFVALIPDTDFEYVKDLCRRIEKAVSSFQMRFGEEEFASVGISVGSASYPKDGEALNDLIVVADKAMYRAKAINKLHRDITPADIVAAAVFAAEPITDEELEELVMSSASN